MTTDINIRPISDNDRPWTIEFLRNHWGSEIIVTKGILHDASCLPGFVATMDTEIVGLLTYNIEGKSCEILSINSLLPGKGVGSMLISAVREIANASGCNRLWLITTNDNLAALSFYQKRGFQLVEIHPNALEESRKLKPEIPLIGLHGIPLRDEIELDMILTSYR